jgi:hypothetical protein
MLNQDEQFDDIPDLELGVVPMLESVQIDTTETYING